MSMFECPFSLYSQKKPHGVAIISKHATWTYQTCEKLIEGIGTELKNLGVKPGDPVAILPTKEFPTPLLFFALFRIGAICSPINTYHPLDTLPENLDDLGASLILYPDEVTLPNLKQITVPFSKVIKEGKLSGQSFLNKEALATYLFTSGTTSKPKIACHTLGNHYYSALGSNAYMPIEESDRYLLSLPLYHIAGIALLFRTFLAGGCIALEEDVPNITHLSLIPTQLKRLLEKEALPNYKHILLGGSEIPFSLYQKARERNLPIHPTYGMTEMSSQITTQFSPTFFSMGHPLPFREIKISQGGEILVKGKTLFKGYLKRDGSFDLPLDKEGYFPTRDLGRFSPKQGLSLLGRKDRLFISGGENIQPEEIERLLKNIEGIIRAEVIPTPDEEYGYRPKAYIQADKPFQEEELKTYLSSYLPKFKIPVSFDPVGDGHTYKS